MSRIHADGGLRPARHDSSVQPARSPPGGASCRRGYLRGAGAGAVLRDVGERWRTGRRAHHEAGDGCRRHAVAVGGQRLFAGARGCVVRWDWCWTTTGWESPPPTGSARSGTEARGTSVGWADQSMGLAVAYITNGFRASATNNPRLAAISRAVRAGVQVDVESSSSERWCWDLS